jgi:hypothetical protein
MNLWECLCVRDKLYSVASEPPAKSNPTDPRRGGVDVLGRRTGLWWTIDLFAWATATWWSKWQWPIFFPEFFGFPLPMSFHRCPSLTYIIWRTKIGPLQAAVQRHSLTPSTWTTAKRNIFFLSSCFSFVLSFCNCSLKFPVYVFFECKSLLCQKCSSPLNSRKHNLLTNKMV